MRTRAARSFQTQQVQTYLKDHGQREKDTSKVSQPYTLNGRQYSSVRAGGGQLGSGPMIRVAPVQDTTDEGEGKRSRAPRQRETRTSLISSLPPIRSVQLSAEK